MELRQILQKFLILKKYYENGKYSKEYSEGEGRKKFTKGEQMQKYSIWIENKTFQR